MPQPGHADVHGAFVRLVEERYVRGLATYGRPLETFNGRDALRDAIEEAIDLGKYLTQAWLEQRALAVRLADLEAQVNRLIDERAQYETTR